MFGMLAFPKKDEFEYETTYSRRTPLELLGGNHSTWMLVADKAWALTEFGGPGTNNKVYLQE